MAVVITKVEEFIKAMSAIYEISEEAVLNFGSEGVETATLDPSNIAMIVVNIPREFFDQYEELGEVGLNFEDFVKILQRMKKDDKIILSKDDSRFIIESIGKSKKKYYLPVLDLSKSNMKKPELEHKAKAKIIAGDLKEIFKDLSLVTQYVKIITQPDQIKLYGSGDNGEVEIVLDKDSECLISIECEEEQKSTYNLEYLISFLKATSKDVVVRLEYSTEAPIELTYYYDDIEISYLLAPRAED